VRTEVYFGLSAPDGSRINASEFQKFIDEVVTPLFPAGHNGRGRCGEPRLV